MKILAYDLGTTFGYALGGQNLGLEIGSVKLATDEEITEWNKSHLSRRSDPRYWRFLQHVMEHQQKASVVVFEDVLFCKGRCQCQLWATWRSALWSVVPAEKLECVPTATLKKFATNAGGAGKVDMAEAMCLDFPSRFTLKGPKKGRRGNDLVWSIDDNRWLDDNAVDAFWLMRWAMENIKR